MNEIKDTLSKQIELDGTFRALFRKHFGLDLEQNKENPGYQAWAGSAIEVGVALLNLVISIKKPASNRGFRAVADLVYTLNANEFWIKNAPVLVPVLTIVLNSHRDYVDMAVRKQELQDYAIYDKMMSAADGASLELFSILLYLVDGPALMSMQSLPLKMDLAPYVLG